MNTTRQHSRRAFTIMELLVVIAIMAIVAGLIVGLAGVTGDSKKIKRTESELAGLVLLIEEYKNKVGVYPPDNPNGNLPQRNALLYELAGAVRRPGPLYTTPFGDITRTELQNEFGLNGIVNARDEGNNDPDANRMHPVLKSLKRDQTNRVFGSTLSLTVPVEGPDGRTNLWKYRVGNPTNTHNPQSFDLWVEIVLAKKTNTIGNWKN